VFLPGHSFARAGVASVSYPAVADFDRDSRRDVAYRLGVGGTEVEVVKSLSDGSFGAPALFAVGRSPAPIAAADLNGDARPDLVVGNSFDQTVSVLLSQSDGGYAPQLVYPTRRGPYRLAIGDVTEDGVLDVIVVGLSEFDAVTVLVGSPTGAFTGSRMYAVGHDPKMPLIADVDEDGRNDIVVVSRFAPVEVLGNFCR
jgi:hypothetical protein